MGAFGRLLIQTLGGNLQTYDNAGCSSTIKRIKTSKEIDDDNIEHDEMMFDNITKSTEQLFEKAENCISQLNKDEDIYNLFKTDKAFDKFLVWRKEFYNKLKQY